MTFSLCRYRGQKTRFADAILDRIEVNGSTVLWDACAGSGAIALAAAARGVPPAQITIIEQGSWGLFWTAMASGAFDPTRFQQHLDAMPPAQQDATAYMKRLFTLPCSLVDAPYTFFLLQSASVHGSAFGHQVEGDTVRWTGSYSCAKYFTPTETSVRRYPTRVMPLAAELMKRTRRTLELLRGCAVIHRDVASVPPPGPDTVVYLDPPYPGTKGYSTDTQVEFPRIEKWARSCATNGARVYASGYEAWKGVQEEDVWSVGGSRMGGAGKAKPKRQELLMRIRSAIHDLKPL